MNTNQPWLPPGKNCGLCGEDTCKSFLRAVNTTQKSYDDCPFYRNSEGCCTESESKCSYGPVDVLGNDYDFILKPLPGEISARKIVLPFRGDMVDKLEIKAGDIVVGRPMGAGCPIPHVLQVIKADPVTGLLYTWVVGPKYSRDRDVKDVVAYHMVGFEGIAGHIRKEPTLGFRHTFLPGFCMMNLNHTGLVNMVLQKEEGPHIRIENILILASKE
ncbi:Fe-S cluster protein [Heliobacterium chlorum]|uniref:Fe-S cluster protein n=1 Tax=Heliobacterium chlorum TaxID=2698 RepID=A0ABR7T4A9_HELCL|nr:(Fe-S)-binding protein [Heliobacterium chlorum]MBC9785613.1 Fe-S cluster protein [Heliobacterium chlorum]